MAHRLPRARVPLVLPPVPAPGKRQLAAGRSRGGLVVGGGVEGVGVVEEGAAAVDGCGGLLGGQDGGLGVVGGGVCVLLVGGTIEKSSSTAKFTKKFPVTPSKKFQPG